MYTFIQIYNLTANHKTKYVYTLIIMLSQIRKYYHKSNIFLMNNIGPYYEYDS